MYTKVKAPKVGYISLQNLLSVPSLMCLGLMIAFSCAALLSETETVTFFPTKAHAKLRILLQTHMHQRYGREQNRPFFSRGGGERRGGLNGGG